jgi:hypothetical protein
MSDREHEATHALWNRVADDWRIQVGDDGDGNRRLNFDPVLWAFAGDLNGRTSTPMTEPSSLLVRAIWKSSLSQTQSFAVRVRNPLSSRMFIKSGQFVSTYVCVWPHRRLRRLVNRNHPTTSPTATKSQEVVAMVVQPLRHDVSTCCSVGRTTPTLPTGGQRLHLCDTAERGWRAIEVWRRLDERADGSANTDGFGNGSSDVSDALEAVLNDTAASVAAAQAAREGES